MSSADLLHPPAPAEGGDPTQPRGGKIESGRTGCRLQPAKAKARGFERLVETLRIADWYRARERFDLNIHSK